MMQSLWNGKFSREGYLYGKSPNLFLASQMHGLPEGSDILFLGEGEGRNACHAAELGHHATALDASDIGLKKAADLAREKGVCIKMFHTDLASWHPDGAYDAVMASFLHLEAPLRVQAFREAFGALRCGGVFVGEFFSTRQLPLESGGPKNIDLLYTEASLRDVFTIEGAEILLLEELVEHLDEGSGHQGDADLIRIVVKKS